MLTSELSLLETLVKPLQVGDALLEATYRSLLTASREVQLVALSRAVILRAAELRAKHGLKTADALHAASGQSCMLFVTNDPAFQRVLGLPVVLLRDLVGP